MLNIRMSLVGRHTGRSAGLGAIKGSVTLTALAAGVLAGIFSV